VRISVITVCFNAEKTIEDTIRSVLCQNYNDFEYIIKDGLSTDSTLIIAEKYKSEFESKDITYRIFSGSDSGIYDAMNIAVGYAEGEWVIYLNSGDRFFDDSVLNKLDKEITDEYGVIYGDVALYDRGFYKSLKSGELDDFKYTNPICHQGVLTKTDVVRDFRFDTDYNIAADFDLYLRIYKSGKYRFKKIPLTVAVYRFDGLSNNNVLKREKEFDLSRKNAGIKRVKSVKLLIIKNVFVYSLRSFLIRVLGNCFYTKFNGWYTDKSLLK